MGSDPSTSIPARPALSLNPLAPVPKGDSAGEVARDAQRAAYLERLDLCLAINAALLGG